MESAPLKLAIATRSGRVLVVAEPGSSLRVRGGTPTLEPDGTTRVTPTSRSGAVEVRCPAGSDLVVGTSQGPVELRGGFGAVSVTTGSGRIDLSGAHAARADLRTGSGRIDVARCDGECRVVAQSGRVEIGWAGTAEVTTSSGRVILGHSEAANVTTTSGRVELATGDRPDVRVRSLSGRVEVAVPEGVSPATRIESATGRVCCECTPGDDGELEVTTTSGAVDVVCR